jgi:hypothetical protein
LRIHPDLCHFDIDRGLRRNQAILALTGATAVRMCCHGSLSRSTKHKGAVPVELSAIDPEQIDKELDARGYLIIKTADIATHSVAARGEYERCLAISKLHPTREKFHYSVLANAPWRKLAIGSSNGLGDPYAQNLQSIYFDLNDKNYPTLGALFKLMVGIRNKLMRVDAAFGANPEQDRFWNACRVHHYPRGGGFMSMHKDTHFPQVISTQIGKPFYQICVLLSRKNADFFSGGGVIIDNRKNRIDLEEEGGFGSLILFDGRTYHGVEDVDLDQVIDFSRADGRLAAFVNLYSVPL